jgi:hypothetical protein
MALWERTSVASKSSSPSICTVSRSIVDNLKPSQDLALCRFGPASFSLSEEPISSVPEHITPLRHSSWAFRLRLARRAS